MQEAYGQRGKLGAPEEEVDDSRTNPRRWGNKILMAVRDLPMVDLADHLSPTAAGRPRAEKEFFGHSKREWNRNYYERKLSCGLPPTIIGRWT